MGVTGGVALRGSGFSHFLFEFWDIQTTVEESKAVSDIHDEVFLVCRVRQNRV